MRKLNPPTRTYEVKVTRPVVDSAGYEGLYRVEDKHSEVPDDWIKPGRYSVGPLDPLTGERVSIESCVWEGRPIGYFRAKRREGEWQFINFLGSAWRW